MASSTVLVLKHDSPLLIGGTVTPQRRRKDLLRVLINFLIAAISGTKKIASFDLYANGDAPVAASAVVTAASVSVNDTVTIGGVVFTAKAAQNIANREFDQSGTDTACAASLAAVINGNTASALIAGLVEGSNVGAACTISSKLKHALANHITIATSNGTRLAITGGLSRLGSGAGGAVAGIAVTL